jgi:hypothetical protein
VGKIYERKLLTKARPMMAADEQVEVVAMAKVGSMRANAARNLVAGVAAGIASGGTVMVGLIQAEAYLILTDRQILIFQSVAGSPGKHLGTIPRVYAHPVDVRDGLLFLKFFLQVDGWTEMLKLTVPPMPPYFRKRGRQFIGSLDAVAR